MAGTTNRKEAQPKSFLAAFFAFDGRGPEMMSHVVIRQVDLVWALPSGRVGQNALSC